MEGRKPIEVAPLVGKREVAQEAPMEYTSPEKDPLFGWTILATGSSRQTN